MPRAIAVAIYVFPLLAAAQQPVRIDGAPQCAACSIRLTRVASLGASSDELLLSARSQLTRDSRGKFYAAPTSAPGRIAVYDSTGSYLRSIGRAGQGPGEFSMIGHHVIGRGDTLHIVDTRNRRYSRIPFSGDTVLAVPMAPTMSGPFAILGSGEIVVRDSPRRGVVPIVVLAPSGELRARTAALAAADGGRANDFAVIADSGSVWRGMPDRYLLEKWSLDGRRLESITRTVPWFPTWPPLTEGMDRGTEPQPTMLLDAIVVPNGRMWTLLAVPDPAFKPLDQDEYTSPANMGQLVDTFVEVLDLERHQVLASQRFPEYLMAVKGTSSYVFSARYNSDDIVVMDVYRVDLVGAR